jgi:hypothetical protein
VHEQVLAGAQAGLCEERVVGGHEDLGKAARGRPVERLRHRHRGALVNDRQLSLAAAPDHRHDAVALLEPPGALAERRDLPRELEAGDVGRRSGRRRIRALALEHVRPVDPGGAHAHQQLATAGLRVRPLLDEDRSILDGYRPQSGECTARCLRGCNAKSSDDDIRVTESR